MILKRIRKRYSDNKNNKFLIQKDDFRIALFWLQLYVYYVYYYVYCLLYFYLIPHNQKGSEYSALIYNYCA